MTFSATGVEQWFRTLYNNTNAQNRTLSEEIRGNIGFLKGKVDRGAALSAQEQNAWDYYQTRNRSVAAVMTDFKNMLPSLFAKKQSDGQLFKPNELDLQRQVLGQSAPAETNGNGATLMSGFSGGAFRWILFAAGGLMVIQLIRSGMGDAPEPIIDEREEQ